MTPVPHLAGRLALIVCLLSFASDRAAGEDWPMWRGGPERSAASTQKLPAQLVPQWQRKFSPRVQAWDDPLNLDLMTYDRVFEPIVIGNRLLIGFNDQDKLIALSTDTGETLWTTYADAPVRLPPAGWQDRVFFCSDDGYLYCVDASGGDLIWKFRGAPHGQHAIGNRRLTSAWPARGGPVVRDDTVYFAASIWPFMGTFLYALDAESGAVRWVNDRTGADYIKQPHSAPSFAGVAPQGALVATESTLLVPGGRSVPAAFDRQSGELRYFELNAGGKGTGGSFVAADEGHFYVHTRRDGTRAFRLNDGVKTAFQPQQPVLHDGHVYATSVDDDVPVIRCFGPDQKERWKFEADASGDLILSGDRLYAAAPDGIRVIKASPETTPQVIQFLPISGNVERLVAANDRLFAVTDAGEVFAFGGDDAPNQPAASKVKDTVEAAPPIESRQPGTSPSASVRATAGAATIMLAPENDEGFAFWYGRSDAPTLQSLIDESPFVQLAVVDPDAARVDRVRRRIDDRERYGKVTVHHGEPRTFHPPQHVAHAVFVGNEYADHPEKEVIESMYRAVRPFGGVMHLLTSGDRQSVAEKVRRIGLEQAEISVTETGVSVRRIGPLPGAADWTHQYGDVANTLKSNDSRVKVPLGILWFGGNSNAEILPRHGHGPPEQVVGGRLFIQGMNSISARDVYTGRVLWKRDFEDLGTFDVYYDATYEDVPLNPKYNQVHIPGANGRGTNYVVTEDRVYVVEGARCHCLDPATGETLGEIEMPMDESGNRPEWGFIGVYQDVLIGGAGFASYRKRHGLKFAADAKLKGNKAGFGSKSFDRAASQALIGFDRHTGKQLWRVDSIHSFWHNGVVAGGDQIYCLDRFPKKVEEAMLRRGIRRPENYRILAIDHMTGSVNWEVDNNVFGTWLGYSERHDLLLHAGANASDRLTDEVSRGMTVYEAGDGKVRWNNEDRAYAGPCILHNDLIITNANSYTDSAGAFYLADGKPYLVKNPLTGLMQPWKVTRAYGCNNIIASENLLTFRSGAAGFHDLLTDAGTGNFGGFKSGCTSNLVAANGVLNAPDYTRTCSCAYQNQTSLALVHMPDVEWWSNDLAAADAAPGDKIQELGINFGAPGDRRTPDGSLWMEYPAVSGASPPVSVSLNPEATFFRQHSSSVSGRELPWVLASGAEGVTDIRLHASLKHKLRLADGIPIVHAHDDAEENEAGEVNRTSSDLELVTDSDRQTLGLRFHPIDIEGGSEIVSAHIQFTCDEPSDEPTSLIFAAEDSSEAARFTEDRHDLTSRPRTTAEVGWEPAPWARVGEAGAAQRTPDLRELVQAVVNRPDWTPGGAIVILVEGNGKRTAASSKAGDADAPRLVVETRQTSPETTLKADAPSFDIEMHFAAPSTPPLSLRNFNVVLQGKKVAEVTLSEKTSERSAVVRCEDLQVDGELHIRLEPIHGKPVISGIKVTRQ